MSNNKILNLIMLYDIRHNVENGSVRFELSLNYSLVASLVDRIPVLTH